MIFVALFETHNEYELELFNILNDKNSPPNGNDDVIYEAEEVIDCQLSQRTKTISDKKERGIFFWKKLETSLKKTLSWRYFRTEQTLRPLCISIFDIDRNVCHVMCYKLSGWHHINFSTGNGLPLEPLVNSIYATREWI